MGTAVHVHPSFRPLASRLALEGRPAGEAERLARLATLLAHLPPPPDPIGLYPRAGELQERLRALLPAGDGEAVEETFLELYAHLHGHQAPYTPAERARMDRAGGYWAHAGGISPVLKAADVLQPGSISLDLGAGNGLQLLLMQLLTPHRLSVQVEISLLMLRSGQALQRWLGVPRRRVAWVQGDVLDLPVRSFHFLYMYRPVKPDGPGGELYRRLARELAMAPREVTVFSVADCLGEFLPPSVERLYSDGHLTCYRLGGQAPPPDFGGKQ